MQYLVGVLGIGVAVVIAFAVSADRRAIRWKQIAFGIALQVVLAVLILRVPGVTRVFKYVADGARWFLSFGDEGARYLFGFMVESEVPVTVGAQQGVAQLGTVLILKMLPTIIFVSSAMSVLYHLGVLQRIVAAMAWVVTRLMRVSGAEALATTANVFMGMTEAPLVIRPYIAGMTSSELFVVMVGGFGTIAGSMMAVYAAVFQIPFEHLLAASILNAPAALYLAKISLPETGAPATLGTVRVHFERDTVNVIDAAAGGASMGLKLALNIGAMLLAFAAGLMLVDECLGFVGRTFGPADSELTLGGILGWIFAPFAWLMGVPAQECVPVGALLGKKVALNEYFAYGDLATATLSQRSRDIATYALCSFANFGSIAIQLGGLGGLVPERRAELARFGLKAMFLGALASFTSAALAGILLPS